MLGPFHRPQRWTGCFTLKAIVLLRDIQKKIPREGGGGKKANHIFFNGWLVLTFFKLYGSLVFEKFCLHGWLGFIENRFKTIDRYIKWTFPVSIKISNPNLPVFLLCEIIQFMHIILIYFV